MNTFAISVTIFFLIIIFETSARSGGRGGGGARGGGRGFRGGGGGKFGWVGNLLCQNVLELSFAVTLEEFITDHLRSVKTFFLIQHLQKHTLHRDQHPILTSSTNHLTLSCLFYCHNFFLTEVDVERMHVKFQNGTTPKSACNYFLFHIWPNFLKNLTFLTDN